MWTQTGQIGKLRKGTSYFQSIKEINTFYETTRRPGVGNVSGRDGAPCSHDGSAAWVDLTLIYWFGIQIMNTVHLFLDIVTMMG